MLMSVSEFRQFVETDETDAVLEARLQALELLIRGYTNNNFQVRGTGRFADVADGQFTVETLNPFEVGDTVYVSGSVMNDGLYTVKQVDGETFRVNERTRDEIALYVELVEYPADVKMGVVEMLKYDLEKREKAGVESESISRHTVQYHALTAQNTVQGYPMHLMGFLKHYMKARFGQGLRA